MASVTSGEALCSYLRKIVASLEQGDAVGAAECVPDMNALLGSLPADISQQQAAEANQLLERARTLERGLRVHVLEAMRTLGAARKSAAYRRIRVRP